MHSTDGTTWAHIDKQVYNTAGQTFCAQCHTSSTCTTTSAQRYVRPTASRKIGSELLPHAAPCQKRSHGRWYFYARRSAVTQGVSTSTQLGTQTAFKSHLPSHPHSMICYYPYTYAFSYIYKHYEYLLHFFSEVKTVLKTHHHLNTIKIPNEASQNSQYSQLVRRQCLSDSWQCESAADRWRCPVQTTTSVCINIHYKAKQRRWQLHSGEIPSGKGLRDWTFTVVTSPRICNFLPPSVHDPSLYRCLFVNHLKTHLTGLGACVIIID